MARSSGAHLADDGSGASNKITEVAGAASARKLLNVILCFSAARPHWSVPELCDTLHVSVSTMYRYVALLREVGLLEQTGVNSYRLTKRFVALAGAAQQGQTLLETVAMPVMTGIRARINETVLVSRRHRHYAYCVERVESSQAVRLQFERGQPMSLHLGSMARVLLAYTPEPERSSYLASVADQIDGKSAAMLSPEFLADVVKKGFTQSFEEVDEGIWGVAAAIRENNEVIAALGVAAPIYRTNARKRQQIISEVRAGANEITRLLHEGTDSRARKTASPLSRSA